MTRCRAISNSTLWCCLWGVASSLAAAEPAVLPVLEPRPDVLQAISRLGENSSCILENTRILEDLGDFAKGWHRMKETGPGGRDFSIKMVWMPDRQRAFFCGANHGSPHRFNDAWEYDLPSNTWVLLYTPDYNDRGPITDYDRETLVLQDGWLRTRKGGPAHPAHTWWGLTYDQQQKKALWFCKWPSYRLEAKLDAIGAKKEDLYPGPPLWTFDPASRSWEPMPSAKPWPAQALAASLEYIPELKGSLWQYSSATWLFDSTRRTWKRFPREKAALPIETLVCYDPERRLLIAHRGPVRDALPRTWHMSLAGDEPSGWEQVLEAPDLPNGHDARSWMYFDPVGKAALLYERAEKAIWAYEPDSRTWTRLNPQGPEPPFEPRERVIAYLDPARNVFVVIGYDRVWCYRYRRKN